MERGALPRARYALRPAVDRGGEGRSRVRSIETTLPGVVLVELVEHEDARGHLVEVYHRDRHAALGVAAGLTFVQDNVARSYGGVVRGLHYQLTLPQGKLVSVIRGAIFDVVVDVR
ncbi:MAG: dTDP-4-keto-6-deoxy-D-glucose epimerase, partial [Kofleriaceae bacterium]